jgi:hypothetical protein
MLFVLVHGSWHGPWVWEHVGAVLRDRGHEVVAPALPTDELGTTWQDYADEILDAVGSRMESDSSPDSRPWSGTTIRAATFSTPRRR